MTDHERGQVDTSAAEVYDDVFVPALFGRFAEQIADAAAIASGDDVVDVACGTGALTRRLRERTTGRVVGVDLNPAMIAVAERHGGDIDYLIEDARAMRLHDGSFDVATCQFGLMFLPQPERGIAEMARVAHRGVVAVWGSIDRSDGYAAMQELFRVELGEDAASSLDAPFAMGVDGLLESTMAEAGVGDVAVEEITGTGRFDSVDQWVTTEVRGWTLGETVPDAQLRDLIGVARTRLAAFSTADGCEFGMSVKLARWPA